jgi:DNA-binding transcriptional LysR family regulator
VARREKPLQSGDRPYTALCETLNFTRAAEKCHVTQPSLTRAIKLLEDELGGLLFNRERNQTHLTELGRAMEPHLREVIEQARSARARAASFFALRTARLKLGVARGVSFHVLNDTLRRFVSSYPDTEIALHDDRASDLREALRRGDFELVLLPQRSLDLDDLHYYPVGKDRLFAILPDGHELAALDEIPLEPLAEQPLVCGDGCPFWEAAERSFRDAGLGVTPKAIATRAEWLFELVAAGVGIGVAARHVDLPSGLVTQPVAGAALAHEINLTTKRGRLYSPPVKAFVDLALKPRPKPQPAASAA